MTQPYKDLSAHDKVVADTHLQQPGVELLPADVADNYLQLIEERDISLEDLAAEYEATATVGHLQVARWARSDAAKAAKKARDEKVKAAEKRADAKPATPQNRSSAPTVYAEGPTDTPTPKDITPATGSKVKN